MVTVPCWWSLLDWCTVVRSDYGLCGLGSILSFRCVVWVQFLDVKAASTLMHVDSTNRTFNLNSLGSISFLRVQLSVSTHAGRVNEHHPIVFGTRMRSVVRCVHECLPRWIESKARLVQLLIKWGVHNLVIVLANALTVWINTPNLVAVFEKLIQNRLLLLVL
jgi:hypothetical protein